MTSMKVNQYLNRRKLNGLIIPLHSQIKFYTIKKFRFTKEFTVFEKIQSQKIAMLQIFH
jgi:hypothetical protein